MNARSSIIVAFAVCLPTAPAPVSASAQTDSDAVLSETELMRQATGRMANDEWAEATVLWSRLLVINPHHVVGYLNRAMSRFRSGDCAGREEDARRALEILADSTRPTLPQLETLVYRAEALGHLQDFPGAITLLETAGDLSDLAPVRIVLSQMRRRGAGTFDWACRHDQM